MIPEIGRSFPGMENSPVKSQVLNICIVSKVFWNQRHDVPTVKSQWILEHTPKIHRIEGDEGKRVRNRKPESQWKVDRMPVDSCVVWSEGKKAPSQDRMLWLHVIITSTVNRCRECRSEIRLRVTWRMISWDFTESTRQLPKAWPLHQSSQDLMS